MKPLQSCKLCLQNRKLCKSHAIPDEFFKLIFRKHSGKAILLPAGSKKIQYSQDSGAVHLLCRECETLLNENCDKYSIKLLKDIAKDSDQNSDIIKVPAKIMPLRLFCLSVLWRASISTSECYKQFNLGSSANEVVRQILVSNIISSTPNYLIRIVRLIDPSKRISSNSNLNELLALPFQSNSDSKSIVFKFIVLGFLFEIYFKKPSRNTLKKLGFTYKNKPEIFIPSEDIFTHPELISSLAKARAKQFSGHTLLLAN